ncbi:MAG: TrmH family RNA methyltransferase [Bacteroidia bacterium]
MKFIKSLAVKKFREREGLFIAEGEKIVSELTRSPFNIHALYYVEGSTNESLFLNRSINLYPISESELKKISLLETPNKVLAVAEIPENKFELETSKNNLTLMLDGVQDPGNMGTILRTADWFGIKNIICSVETVDVFNPKVVQASMGSLFRMKVYYYDLEKILIEIKNQMPVYAAVTDGENIRNKKLTDKSILLLGNESKGIKKELLQYADEKISIPSGKDSKAESLNVAVSSAILLYELLKY